MPSRSRKNKGRAPKPTSLSEKPAKSKKSGSLAGSEPNSRCSTPNSTNSGTPSTRSSRRLGARPSVKKPVSTVKKLPQLQFESDSEKDHAAEFDIDSDTHSESDDEFMCDEEFAPEETTQDEEKEDELSETGSVKQSYSKRPVTPDIILGVDESDIPTYKPPESSTDLPISGNELLKAIGIYEILRHFHILLRLSPFRFEDFCAALTCDDQCNLVAEIHTVLLKTVLREEDGNQTWYGPPDTKDSVNIQFLFLDAMTWYECSRIYLESSSDLEFRKGLPPLEKGSYFEVKLPERLEILHTLTNLFIASNGVREDILKEGNIRYDDHCRNCHKLGDLLCCETCSAVYHLGCVDPPLADVPEDDWHCSVCTAHQEVDGVMNCVMDAEKHGLLIRHDPIGIDRHRRKYWLICRRIIIEGDGEVWYYSSEPALNELIESLDSEYWEQDLVRELEKIRGEIVRQMGISEKLTNKFRGNRKSVLEDENTNLLKIQSAREEERKRLEEEKQQKEEAERLQREAEEAEEKRKQEGENHEKSDKESGDVAAEGLDKDSNVHHSNQETNAEQGQGDVPEGDNKPQEALEISEAVNHSENSRTTETLVTTSDGKSEESLLTTAVTTTVTTTTTTTTRLTKSPVPENEELAAGKPTEGEDPADGQQKQETEANQTQSEDTEKKPTVPPGSITKTMMVVNKDGTRTLVTLVSKPAENQGEGTPASASDSQTSTESGENTEEKRRISTRSKTGNLAPKNLNDYVTITKGSLVKAAQKMQSSNQISEEIEVVKEGNQIKMTRSKTMQQAQSIQRSFYFKLGEENSYKSYVNQYSTYPLALNKHQHNEERDRKRQLSHKFSLTQLSEFKWSGSIHGSKTLTVATLRNALTAVENGIPSPFLHPNWHNHRQNWIKIVNLCSEPRHFAQALSYLELVIKPVLFNPAWHEGLGHINLTRITLHDRELEKKKDRELEKLAKKTKDKEEEEVDRSLWCKYTLGLKHQIWKLKGEEYRIVHGDGWQWLSATRNYRFEPQVECGLRAMAKKLEIRRTKVLEAKIEEELSHINKDDEDITDDEDIKDEKPDIELKKEVPEPEKGDNSQTANDQEIKEEIPDGTKDEKPTVEIKTEEVDISDDAKIKTEDSEGNSDAKIKTEEEEGSLDVKVKTEDGEGSSEDPSTTLGDVSTEDVKMITDDEPKEEEMDIEQEKDKDIKETKQKHKVNKQDPVAKCAKKMRKTPSPVKYKLKPEDHAFLDTISAKNLTDEEKESEVLNISEAIRLHRHYPKMTKPYSKLDHLLERRQKQWMVEQRQKMIIDQVLLKYRVQNLQKKQALEEKKNELEEKKKSGDLSKDDKADRSQNASPSVMEVDDSNMEMTGIAELDDCQSTDSNSHISRNSPTPPPSLPYTCYSVLCRCKGEVSFKNPPRACYSVSCSFEQRHQLLQSLKERNAKTESSAAKKRKPSNLVDITLDGNSSELPNGLLDSLDSEEETDETESKKKKLDDNQNQSNEEKDQFQNSFLSFLKKSGSEKDEKESESEEKEEKESKSEKKEDKESKSEQKESGVDSDCPISIDDTDDSSDSKMGKGKENIKSDEKESGKVEGDKSKEGEDKDENVAKSDNTNSVNKDKADKDKKEKSGEGKVADDKKNEVTKVAKIEPDGKTFMLGDQRLPLIEQTDEELHNQARKFVVTIDNLTFTNIMHGGKLQLTPSVIPELELKRYMVGKTVYQLTLHRFAKGGRAANRGRFILKKGAIPPVHKFLTKMGKKSLFVLEKYDLHQLARRSGKREVPGFKYECKMNNVGWIYPCPRPYFKSCWRYRTQNIKNLAAAALQLRILWSCLRWDDMSLKAPQGGQYTVTTDEEVVTTEVIKRKDVGSYGLRSEYLIRKIVVPLNMPEEPKRDYTPIRSGLRERRRAESPKQREPSMTEKWTPEEKLDLWEIKWFGDKVEKSISMVQDAANRQLIEKQRKEEQLKKQEDFKAKIEDQLKQQRQAMQQKRLQEIQAKKDGTTPPFIIKKVQSTNPTGNTPGSSVRVISSSSSGSSVLKIAQPLSSMDSNTTVITRLIHPKNLGCGANKGSGVVQLSSPTVSIRPKVLTTSTAINAVTTPKVSPNVRAIAPSPGPGVVKTSEAVVKPATPGGQVQNLRIMQLPNGQLQVQGLMPGQQLVRQPDGKLQLITAKSASPQTPIQQPLISPQSPTAGSQPGLKVIKQSPPVVIQQQQAPLIQVQSQPKGQVTMIQQKAPAQLAQPASTQALSLAQIVGAQAKSTVNATSQANTPRLIQIQLPGQPPQQVLIQGNQLQALQALQQQKSGGQVQGQTINSPVQNQQGKVTILQKGGITTIQGLNTSPVAGSAQSLVSSTATPSISITPPRIITTGLQAQSPPMLTSAIASQLGNLGSNPVLVRTPSGQIGILRPQGGGAAAQLVGVTNQAQLGQVRASAPGTIMSPPASGVNVLKTDGSKTVAPNVIQQVLQRAMLQNEDPDIQAKIQALQKNLGSSDQASTSMSLLGTNRVRRDKYSVSDKDVDSEWDIDPSRSAPALKERLIKGSKSELTGKTKTNWPKSKEEMEDQTRQAICSSVIKSIIDKIEKKEKAEQRAQKKTIVAEEKREKARSSQLSANLFKQKESLKTDMMKKRALMEKTIQQEVQHDLRTTKKEIRQHLKEQQKVTYINKKKRKRNEVKEARRKSSSKHVSIGNTVTMNIPHEEFEESENLQQQQLQLQQMLNQQQLQQQRKQQEAAQKRKRRRDSSADYELQNSAVSPNFVSNISIPSLEQSVMAKKEESHSSGASSRKKRKLISIGGDSSRKLYCVCKTPYDQSKFYVGCDLCSNWFHGRCINISESQAKYLDSYQCDECKIQAEGTSEELYCICRTPYDEAKFYIGCDHCNDWFHGSCVGITKSEADSIDTYLCPRCQESSSPTSLVNERVIEEDHWEQLMDVLHSLKIHKMSWPFREPVDPEEVPDYYTIVKEPMDLSTIERKLDTRRYVRIGDFIKDIMKVFDNCRFYNPNDTPFYKCAEVLETHFVQAIKNLEDTL